MVLLMEDSFFYQLLIYSSLDDNHIYCIRCYIVHREEVILEEAGGILCNYRGHLITNLVAGKENIVHNLISQCINK